VNAHQSRSSRRFRSENLDKKQRGRFSRPLFRVSAHRPIERSRQPADVKRLDLEIFFYSELGSFTSQARLLYTTERRNFSRDQAGVQTDHAEFQRLGNTP
jgi:hypothetical protein